MYIYIHYFVNQDASADGIYAIPAVPRPTPDKVRELAERRGLDFSESDLQDLTSELLFSIKVQMTC